MDKKELFSALADAFADFIDAANELEAADPDDDADAQSEFAGTKEALMESFDQYVLTLIKKEK